MNRFFQVIDANCSQAVFLNAAESGNHPSADAMLLSGLPEQSPAEESRILPGLNPAQQPGLYLRLNKLPAGGPGQLTSVLHHPEQTAVISKAPELLKQLQTIPALRELKLILDSPNASNLQNLLPRLHGIMIAKERLTAALVEQLHEQNLRILTGPVNTADDLNFIRQFNIDAVITENSQNLMPLLQKQHLRPEPIPRTTRAWLLHGAGMENFGDNNAPAELPIPELQPDEMLCRVDAIGLCFSDIKIIRAGESHPKIWIEDLKKEPLIIGHEAILTIVKTGAGIPLKYAPGQRYVVQPDVFIKGKSCAYGYGMNGGLTEYSVIDSRLWQGEKESYLLDCPDYLPSVSLALLEPWTCVRAAYHISHRQAPEDGGRLLLVTGTGCTRIPRTEGLFRNQQSVTAVNFSPEAVKALEEELSLPVRCLDRLPEDELFDDIVCFHLQDKELGKQALSLADYHAVISFIGDCGDHNWDIDVGALHYKNRYYQGAAGDCIDDAYKLPRRQGLKKNGAAWFPGGAGAMGQMHVELAIISPDGPKKILVTDMDSGRISHLKNKLCSRAEEQQVQLEILNPGEFSPVAFEEHLRTFAPDGFDDIVVLVPSSKIIDQALPHLAVGGLINVFAGIPAGETSPVSIRRIIENGIRFTGSSGSSPQDMKDALKAAENREFTPQSAIAAIAGLNAVKRGYEAAARAEFPGKIVILPGCPDLPLTPFTPENMTPEMAATLDRNHCYTAATEDYLMNKWKKRR